MKINQIIKRLRYISAVCVIGTSIGFATTLMDDSNSAVLDAFGAPVTTGKYYNIVSMIMGEACPKVIYNGIQTQRGIFCSLSDNGTEGGQLSWYGVDASGKRAVWYFDNKTSEQAAGQNLGNGYMIRNVWGSHIVPYINASASTNSNNLQVKLNNNNAIPSWTLKRGWTSALSDTYTNIQFYQFLNSNYCIAADGAISLFKSDNNLALSVVNQFCFIPLATSSSGKQYIPDGKSILNFGSSRGTWAYIPNCAGMPIGTKSEKGTNWDALMIGSNWYGGYPPTAQFPIVRLLPTNGEFVLVNVWDSGTNDDGNVVKCMIIGWDNRNDLFGSGEKNRLVFPTAQYTNVDTVVTFLGLTHAPNEYIRSLYFKVVRVEYPAPSMN